MPMASGVCSYPHTGGNINLANLAGVIDQATTPDPTWSFNPGSGAFSGPVSYGAGANMYDDGTVFVAGVEGSIDAFRTKAEEAGCGYQTLINKALRQHLYNASQPVDSKTLRRILREELNKTS